MFNPHAGLSSTHRRLIGLCAFVGLLAAWQLVAMSGHVSSNKLPSPVAVARALAYLSWWQGNSMLAHAVLASVTRIALAAVFVICIGLPLGVVMGASPGINAALSPLIDPFRSAPVVALLPILIMWFGIDEEMKVIFLFLGAIVYLVPMVRDAIVAVPYAYWESTRDLGATHYECITRSVLPMAMPRIVDSVIASVSIMWTYITVAEYVNAGQGLGQMIQNSLRFSAMDQVFAGIFVIVVLALGTYSGLTWLKRRVYFWEGR